MTANKLITIYMGKRTSGIQQGDQVAQMSTEFSQQNSNQKKALESVIEAAFIKLGVDSCAEETPQYNTRSGMWNSC